MPRVIRTVGAIALVAGIGVLDALVSARLPLSILYFAPVIGAAWYIGRSQGLVVAVVAIAARFITDIHWNSIDALSLVQALLWGGALIVAPRLTAWAHARREEVTALESRIN